MKGWQKYLVAILIGSFFFLGCEEEKPGPIEVDFSISPTSITDGEEFISKLVIRNKGAKVEIVSATEHDKLTISGILVKDTSYDITNKLPKEIPAHDSIVDITKAAPYFGLSEPATFYIEITVNSTGGEASDGASLTIYPAGKREQ